ncbi:MAG: ABC transporter permease subunit [Candidatus Cloacimonetes bacterium]|nr:ABC transporter permease subunit [Candidatus Cloacimonadota bacterium]
MKSKQPKALTWLLIIFFLFSVVIPLGRMLAYLFETDVVSVVSSGRFMTGLVNSLTTSLTATLISVILAAVLAWSLERLQVKGKAVFAFLFIVPMLIPSISHGTGLVILLGRNGIITNLLHLDFSIYGFWGIVLGSVMYSFPVAFLMLSDILRYEDSTPYEAASVLGIPKRKQFQSIFVPFIRKPLISIIFAVFTLIITDYGVPLMVGGQCTTLPVVMYQDVIGMLDFGKGSVIGVVLLVPAFIAFVLDSMNRDHASLNFTPRQFEKKKSPVGMVACIIASILILLPIAAFLVISLVKKYPIDMTLTWFNVMKTFQQHAGRYLLNSLLISLIVSAVGVTAAFASAYLSVRTNVKQARILHLLSIISLSIPGIVLGLSYVLLFKGTFLSGTFAIIILANLMHFFSSPYLMMYNTLGKINPNLEDVGETLGLGRTAIIRDVIIPQSFGTILEMAVYFFVNSMMTISAVSFLSTYRTQPLALMIPMFEGQMQIECIGVVSLIILIINVLLKLLISTVSTKKRRDF